MRAVDPSVVVPAFVQWHEAHDEARPVASGSAVPAHVLAEAYAVLTRLPGPHRLAAGLAAELLAAWFPPDRVLEAPPSAVALAASASSSTSGAPPSTPA